MTVKSFFYVAATILVLTAGSAYAQSQRDLQTQRNDLQQLSATGGGNASSDKKDAKGYKQSDTQSVQPTTTTGK